MGEGFSFLASKKYPGGFRKPGYRLMIAGFIKPPDGIHLRFVIKSVT